MNQARILKVLKAPLSTEKAYRIADSAQQISFKVATNATKLEVKHAVEKLFDVKVAEVRTINVKGKARRFGRIEGRTKNWKKAYVSLMPGYDINFGDAA